MTLFILVFLVSGCFVKEPSVKKIENKGNISEERASYIYTEATKLKLLGQHKKAIQLFKKYIERYPESSASYYQMAQIYYSNGDTELAKENIDQAIKIDQENEWYKKFLVSIYRKEGNIDGLIQLYEKMLLASRDDDIQYELAMLYQRRGNYEKAIALLDELERNYGISEKINIPKYENYLMLEKSDSAFKEINKLIRVFPERPEYYGILAEYYVQEDSLSAAKENYDKLFELDSSNIKGKISYVDYLIKKGSLQEAFDISHEIVKNESVNRREKVELLIGLLSTDVIVSHQNSIKELIDLYDQTHKNEASALTLYADFYLKTNQLDLALDKLKKLVQIDKTNYMYWEQLIMIENERGNTDSVIKYSNKAINLFPEMPNLYLINGISRYYNEDYKGAVVNLEEGYIINKDKKREELQQQFIIFLAECYNQLNAYKEADKYFEMAIKRYPDNYVIKNNYAYYLSLREEKLDFAKKISKETLEKEPMNPTYLDTYAWILYKMGNYKEAYSYIEKAIQLGAGDNSEVLDHCGDILIALEKFDDAIYMYQQALEYDENNERIKNKLKEYEQNK